MSRPRPCRHQPAWSVQLAAAVMTSRRHARPRGRTRPSPTVRRRGGCRIDRDLGAGPHHVHQVLPGLNPSRRAGPPIGSGAADARAGATGRPDSGPDLSLLPASVYEPRSRTKASVDSAPKTTDSMMPIFDGVLSKPPASLRKARPHLSAFAMTLPSHSPSAWHGAPRCPAPHWANAVTRAASHCRRPTTRWRPWG